MDFDVGLNTMHGKLSNRNILKEVNDSQEEGNNNDKNKNDNGETITKPGIEKARKAIEKIVVSIKNSYVTKNKSILLMF